MKVEGGNTGRCQSQYSATIRCQRHLDHTGKHYARLQLSPSEIRLMGGKRPDVSWD